MPDIFGRELHDYKHLAEMEDEYGPGSALDYLRERAALNGTQAHGFMHRASVSPAHTAAADVNTQALGLVQNNLEAVQSMIEEILYQDYRLDRFVPIKTDIPEAAETYSYRIVDRVGRGKFIDVKGHDAPSASVGQRKVSYNLEYAGIVPEWSIEDLRKSVMTGVPLDSATVRAAMDGAMDHIEEVGLKGDSNYDFKGFTNLATTGQGKVLHTNNSASGKNLSALDTNDARVRVLQDAVKKPVEETNEVFGRKLRSGMTAFMPIGVADYLTTTRMGVDNFMSLWQYFNENNIWRTYTGADIPIEILPELKDAGASSSDRIIFAMKDTRIYEMPISIMPRSLTTLNLGYCVQVPMEYKMGGVNVKRPEGIHYLDNNVS